MAQGVFTPNRFSAAAAARVFTIAIIGAALAACGDGGTNSSTQGANGPPTITGKPASSVVVGGAYSFKPTAADSAGNPLLFSVDGLPPWASFDSLTGELSGTPTAADAGTYHGIAISVTDGSNETVLPPFDITVQPLMPSSNKPPSITGIPTTSVAVGSRYTFIPFSHDPDGDTMTFAVQNQPKWASFDPTTGRLQGTPAASDAGTYRSIVVSVSDGMSTNTLAPFSIQVTASANQPSTNPATNQAPTISGTPATSVKVGDAYAFTPKANDADGDALTFSIANKPAWASFDSSTGALTGTPAAADVASYSGIVISVSDGKQSASLAALTITVQAVANGSATLNWVAPTQRTDGTALTNLAGYKVYWGETEGSYPNAATITNPGMTTYQVDNLGSGTWYFVMTAYDTNGIESGYSNPASKTVP